MNEKFLVRALVFCLLFCLLGDAAAFAEASAAEASAQLSLSGMREQMKQSLVFLDISCYSYDVLRPWNFGDVRQKQGVGCAVGDYEVITPAWNLTDAKLIKVRRFGQNEYIAAEVKVIDYEVDLALLQLDVNSVSEPLRPLKFVERYEAGAKLDYYWLGEQAVINSGHGYLERAQVRRSTVSYGRLLNYIVTNTSGETGVGQVYCYGEEPIGIACWSEGTKEAGLIPAEVINSFLADVEDGSYEGFAGVGFSTDELLDPTMRARLQMGDSVKHGVLVTDVYNLGTGSGLLRAMDVVLAIDGTQIGAYGRFDHPLYDEIFFDHLITSHSVGDEIEFDIWRDGGEQQIEVEARTLDVQQMLVPFYEYGRQQKYIVTGGFVFQKLTRPYLANWGKGWQGRVTPHLYHYYRDMAFKPTAERSEIVILSYVLPAEINLGYKDLGQIVVRKLNGMEIRCIEDVVAAQKLNSDAAFDVVEFELDNPTVVIPRDQLAAANALIASNYGISQLANLGQ